MSCPPHLFQFIGLQPHGPCALKPLQSQLTTASQDTHARVTKAAIEALPTDISLVSASDYILSIVPPRDALATAKRIIDAFIAQASPKTTPLYYLDLNAISPRSAREIATQFTNTAPEIRFVDGGIIGGAPKLKNDPEKTRITNVTTFAESEHAWNRPSSS
jgi:3-hydroxyisobutyrate dehydrogenase-like beta-hydroxyacid dehydrogenase